MKNAQDVSLQLRNELITNHIPLANKLAWKKWKKTPKCVDIEELQSAAYMGLVDAAEKFQEDRDVTFGSYARILIQGAICDYLRELSWGCRKDPMLPVSLDAPVDSEEGTTFTDLVEDDERPESKTLEFFEEVAKALPAIGSDILLLYYVHDMSQKEIGNAIGVSESRVCQLLSGCRDFIEKKWNRGDLWALAA
mgnify:CR=1 FL=1